MNLHAFYKLASPTCSRLPNEVNVFIISFSKPMYSIKMELSFLS